MDWNTVLLPENTKTKNTAFIYLVFFAVQMDIDFSEKKRKNMLSK